MSDPLHFISCSTMQTSGSSGLDFQWEYGGPCPDCKEFHMLFLITRAIETDILLVQDSGLMDYVSMGGNG